MLSEIVRYVAVFCSGIAIALSIAGNTRYKDCKEYLEYRRRAEGCLREAQKQIENHQKKRETILFVIWSFENGVHADDVRWLTGRIKEILTEGGNTDDGR